LSGILTLLLLAQTLKNFGAWRHHRARYWLTGERRPLWLTVLWLLRTSRTRLLRLAGHGRTRHHWALRNYRRTGCARKN